MVCGGSDDNDNNIHYIHYHYYCYDYHCSCTDQKLVFAWGKNDVGQLGRGFESPYEVLPDLVKTKVDVEKPIQVSCGANHTIILMDVTRPDDSINRLLFAWGDNEYGQLGSGDTRLRHSPQVINVSVSVC